MKERPMLFSGSMVLAILDGRKTNTRRTVSGRFLDLFGEPDGWEAVRPGVWSAWCHHTNQMETFACPYGVPGDRLWVRETWAPHADEEETCRNYHAARTGLGGIAEPGGVRPELFYRADGGDPHVNHWRPSIHMPRWASRLSLEVVSVRGARLHDISEADARAEGCAPWPPRGSAVGQQVRPGFDTAREAFQALWADLYGQASWDANPWLWVVAFKKAEG